MTTQNTSNNRPQLLAVLRRRRWSMLIAFAAALLVTVTTAFLWPPTYISTGTILIEQQEVPIDLVRSTISSFADQRIQMINQRVMTSDNLLGIVQKFNLYPELRKKRGREAILDRIREDIRFGSIKASVIDPRQGRPVEATIAFSLSFVSRSPETAARVANEISSLYLQENLESRKRLAEQAAGFLTEEGDRLSKQIGVLQASLAQFKEKHVGNLPESTNLNLQFVSRADDEMRDVDTQLRALDQQVVFLDAQLAQISKTSDVYTSTGQRVMSSSDRLKYLRTEYARASAIYAPDHPDVVRLKREIDGLAADAQDTDGDNARVRQLQDAQTELASARNRYAPEHPDVLRLEKLVATLSDPAIARVGANKAAVSSDPPDNPAYLQLQAQREAAANQRTSLQRKRSDLVARVANLERMLAATPGVEKDYMEMARELAGTQHKYEEVRQKQMEAQLAQNLEAERKGERFSLIDPPVAPDEPSSPNRKLILILGIVLAIGLAIGIAALRESTDRRVRGRGDLLSLLTVPPLAVIPWIENAAQRAARTRQRRYAFAGSVATFALAVVAVHLFYRPLDVLWAIAMRRLGS
jgi:uncharacterized protein involved in exopolysaccharide biosynthesis